MPRTPSHLKGTTGEVGQPWEAHMSKNILDHAEQSAEGSRVEKFTGIERSATPSEAAKLLQRRPRTDEAGDARTGAYLRIDRDNSD